MKCKHFIVLLIGWLFASCSFTPPEEKLVADKDLLETNDFNFHVRPILSDCCYCHSPDANTRKARLRLDLEKEALATLNSVKKAFVSGKPGSSGSVNRILTDEPDIHIAPPESNLALSAIENAMFIKWIEQGAEWKAHWAFKTSPHRCSWCSC